MHVKNKIEPGGLSGVIGNPLLSGGKDQFPALKTS